MQPAIESTIAIAGTPMHYTIEGDGPALVLIHGGLGNLHMWDDQMHRFAQEFRVVRFDLPGMGHSPLPTGTYSEPQHILLLLQALGLDHAHVLGLSYGGRVALDFALTYPSHVDSLILSDTALGGWAYSEDLQARNAEIDRIAEDKGVDEAVELELQLWLHGTRPAGERVAGDVWERLRVMNKHNWDVQSEDGEPVSLDPPAIERLGEISVPTLVMVGEYDTPDTLQIADLLYERIGGARRVTIPQAAHHPNLEQAGLFSDTVLAFLRDVEHGSR